MVSRKGLLRKNGCNRPENILLIFILCYLRRNALYYVCTEILISTISWQGKLSKLYLLDRTLVYVSPLLKYSAHVTKIAIAATQKAVLLQKETSVLKVCKRYVLSGLVHAYTCGPPTYVRTRAMILKMWKKLKRKVAYCYNIRRHDINYDNLFQFIEQNDGRILVYKYAYIATVQNIL